MWTNFRFSLTNVTSFFFNLHSPLQIPGLPLMNDTGPASALQPWTSACHPRPATPPPSPRLPPHPPPSPPPPPWSPLTAAGALSHTSSRGWVQVVHTEVHVTSGSHHHSSVFHFESGLSDLISHIEFDAQRGFVEDVEHSESLAISISGLEMWLERNLIRSTSAICKRCYTLIANGGEVKPHKWLALTDKESCGALASLT